MPVRPSTPCQGTGCHRLTTGSAYCPHCTSEREQRRNRARADKKRIYNSSAWKSFRESILSACPMCAICKEKPATDVHHIRTLQSNPEDAYDPRYVQAMCHECHSVETAREVWL